MTDLAERIVASLLDAGCAAAGVCGVEPLEEARRVIEQRRSAGLHAGMQFVYRNPGRSTDPRAALPSARSAVVAALPYGNPASADVAPTDRRVEARVARYASCELYERLRQILRDSASLLVDAGYRGVVLADDNALVDRAMALRAGLGWQGKNTNLLVPGVGSWVVLGSILTDAELQHTPADTSAGCGSCERCLQGCPTGALVAPGVLDAHRCLSWLLQTTGPFPREYRRALGERIYGCDDCQEVCPPSRADIATQLADGGPGGRVPLEFLLAAPDDELMERVGSWYIPSRDPRFVRRNALVVLGNSGAGSDPVLMDLLGDFLRCGDDLLVEHAAWAARALGRDDLLAATDVRELPAVRAELGRAHPASTPVSLATLAASSGRGETGP